MVRHHYHNGQTLRGAGSGMHRIGRVHAPRPCVWAHIPAERGGTVSYGASNHTA